MAEGYARSLHVALRHRALMLTVLVATVGLNIWLYTLMPFGFFPQQDTGRLNGGIQADQNISFQLMRGKLQQFIQIVGSDPAVESVVGFTGGSQTNTGNVFVALKSLAERNHLSSDQVIGRLRGRLAKVPGARLFLQASQDVRVGGRQSNAQYQYTLQSDDLNELRLWAPRLTNALLRMPELADVNSDQQDKGLETELAIDRDTAYRLNLTTAEIDNTLYDAFGQRQVSNIYNALNQYHVVMEVAPQYWQDPETLKDIWISTSGGGASGTQTSNAVAGTTVVTGQSSAAPTAASVAADSARNAASNALAASGHSSASAGAAVSTSTETMIPLAAIARYKPGTTPLAVNHQGHFVATTISFNLPPDKSLSDAVAAIAAAERQIGMPTSVHGTFAGTARTFQESLKTLPILVVAALLAVYIVLGVLYESYIHPLTILSTLPSAGVGALLALMICGTEFSLIAMIGVLLLIGIVKKNAIMMIDFALDAERNQGLSSEDSIYQACLLRFRPIMMTTMVALLGALPLALGHGDGAELRRPLGVSIVGGLLVSQILTLYTTPVVYLTLDRLRRRRARPLPGIA